MVMDIYKIIEEKKRFGKHVLFLRRKIKSSDYPDKFISQQELSDRSDSISKKTIGEIERGETNPSFETLYVLAKALNVSLKELFNF
ncbi:MAG: helix-turn-helix domain-containing protein [Flavobacteriaceae bacterium]|nr:helix-turn-helix domain-containing protein [Flavobacteriaceae bacterium]